MIGILKHDLLFFLFGGGGVMFCFPVMSWTSRSVFWPFNDFSRCPLLLGVSSLPCMRRANILASYQTCSTSDKQWRWAPKTRSNKELPQKPPLCRKRSTSRLSQFGCFLGLIYFKQMAVRFCGRPWTVCVFPKNCLASPLTYLHHLAAANQRVRSLKIPERWDTFFTFKWVGGCTLVLWMLFYTLQ